MKDVNWILLNGASMPIRKRRWGWQCNYLIYNVLNNRYIIKNQIAKLAYFEICQKRIMRIETVASQEHFSFPWKGEKICGYISHISIHFIIIYCTTLWNICKSFEIKGSHVVVEIDDFILLHFPRSVQLYTTNFRI